MRYFLYILLLPSITHAQSISVSPQSFYFWGAAEYNALADIEYNQSQIVILYAYKPRHDPYGDISNGLYPAVFYTPIKLGNTFYTKGSAGLFLRRYPTKNGQHLHFRFQAGINFGRLSIEYSHISNGFGIYNSLNEGADHISLRFNF